MISWVWIHQKIHGVIVIDRVAVLSDNQTKVVAAVLNEMRHVSKLMFEINILSTTEEASFAKEGVSIKLDVRPHGRQKQTRHKLTTRFRYA